VRDVGGCEKVIAGGTSATVIASGEKQGFDLAVLQVEGLWDKPQLSLCASAEEEQPFIIAGFYQFDPKSPPALRKIRGKLGEQISLASSDGRERINAWDLRIEGEYYLQPGYSGSPVINQASGCVLSVVTHQIGKGEKGLAISIEALRKIWQEMPSGLISKSPSPQASRNTTFSGNIVSNSNVKNLAGHVTYNEASNSIRELTINFPRIETVPQTPSATSQQIQRLQKRLEEALNLLDEYEQQELLTTDAKTRRNAQVEQERLRQQIDRYRQEIKNLEY
jgi:hypothetical protein